MDTQLHPCPVCGGYHYIRVHCSIDSGNYARDWYEDAPCPACTVCAQCGGLLDGDAVHGGCICNEPSNKPDEWLSELWEN